MTVSEKSDIGTKICRSLVRKISWDMQIASGLIEQEQGSQSMEKAHRTLHRLSKACVASIRNLKNPDRIIRSRFYFTSESHVVALLNTLRYGCQEAGMECVISEDGQRCLEQTNEYNYLTAITIRLFEDTNSSAPVDDPSRYHIEMNVSPGINLRPSMDESPTASPCQFEPLGCPGEAVSDSEFSWTPPFQLNPEGLKLETLLDFLTLQVPAVGKPTDPLKALQRSPQQQLIPEASEEVLVKQPAGRESYGRESAYSIGSLGSCPDEARPSI